MSLYLFLTFTKICLWAGRSSKQASARAPSALDFGDARSGDSLLAVLLVLWLCVLIDGFVVGVESLSTGNDGIERPFPGLENVDLRLETDIKLSLRFWTDGVRSCAGSNLHFDGH